jgi:lipopolysaccharide heptosyltransferase III
MARMPPASGNAIVRGMSNERYGLKDAVPLQAVKRALVIKLRHHGDVLLSSPVFTVLKKHAPHIEIDALVYAETAPMLDLHPAIATVHRIDRAWKRQGLGKQSAEEWALLSALRQRNYDLVIHLTEHPRGAWLAQLLGARYSVAPKVPGKGRWWRASFSHLYALPLATRRHTVELNLDALRRIGVQPGVDERWLTLVPGADAERRVNEILIADGLHDAKFVHLHPTSRWQFKCWEPEKNAALIDALASRGHRVVLTAGPDASELDFIARIKAAANSEVVDLAGKLSLKELAALTARAWLFIGVDSAPMHMAAAMGTPVVALFGPSGEIEWGPWLVPHRVVSSSHPCRPCGNDGCGGGKVSECLTSLALQPVLAAADELLAR